MTAFMNALTKAAVESIIPPAARTASFTSSPSVDMQKYEGIVLFVLDSGAGTGTTPTLDINLQESDSSAGSYTNFLSFAQVTTVAGQQILRVDIGARKRFIRAFSGITGTTPQFIYGVSALGMAKYV